VTICLKTWTGYDNIEVDINDTGCENVDWIRVVECMETWRALGNTVKANSQRHTAPMQRPCRSQTVPVPYRAALIHTCHAAPLPFSDSTLSFVKVRGLAENIRTASPTV
jgi:hypothetical protein